MDMPVAFGPYEVLARIAASRTSQTFIALHVGADGFRRVVCLKTLQPELCSDETAKTAFANAAKIAAKLNHPACVGVESFGQERGIYYLTMEYVSGETWASVLSRASRSDDVLRPEIVAHMIAELCEGLHHAHELRGPTGPLHVVHRGISPTNILIDDDGRPRIIDFDTGKSALSKDATETGVIKGSFRYMSPEQIIGREPDRRCDIYSLGEVLFESLAPGTSSALELEQLASAKLDEHPRLKDVAPNVDPALDLVCAKALAVEPEERFQSAAEMHFALASYLKKKGVTKGRALLAEAMKRLSGDQIAKRLDVMRKLTFGSFDLAELLATFKADAVTERDLFEGSHGRFDEESFLATIRAGEMDRAPEPKIARPSLAEAKLHLRGPRSLPTPPPKLEAVEPQKPVVPPQMDVADMETEAEPVDPEPTSWSALIDIGDSDW